MNLKILNPVIQKNYHAQKYTGRDIIFCVIDSGVQEVGLLSGKVMYADEYKTDQIQPNGHGTFIASQLISWCPDATIISYCVFPNGKGNTDMVNVALEDVIKRAKSDPKHQYICNMSLSYDCGTNVMTPKYTKMKSLIHTLNSVRVPVFVSAGNDGSEQLYIYPSRWEDPVCVAGLTDGANPAAFSTWHDQCDFGEEAVNVSGLYADGSEGHLSGTSMACPIVAAKGALLACRIRDVTGTWPTEMQLYEQMKQCAVDVVEQGYDKHSGYGFADIRKVDGSFKSLDEQQRPSTVADSARYLLSNIRDFFSKRLITLAAVEYSRVLRVGMNGPDVKAVKDRLVELGYLHKSTHATFGSDTKAAVKKYQADNRLEADGVVGPVTWNALFPATNNNGTPTSSITWTRNLAFGMSGDDVQAAKDKLVCLGYLHASTKNTFGSDTKNAVISIQRDHALNETGIIDQPTWNVIFGSATAVKEQIDPSTISIPAHIITGRNAIAQALAQVSESRREMCLHALSFAVDPNHPDAYPYAFYIRGGNLYNVDLSLNTMTSARLNTYFGVAKYAQYYDGGRKEMMQAASADTGYTIPGADCSGTIVGLWRKYGMQGNKFDANANSLYSRYCTTTSNPIAGDLAWKDGHIGLYVGGGYVVESAGGAYGFVLSNVGKRMIYSFIDKKLHRFSDWSGFGKPKNY